MQGIRAASIVVGSFLALSLTRCGGDGAGAPPDFDAFLGTWSCSSTSTVVITKPSGLPTQVSVTPVTLVVTKSGASTVTIGDEGDPTCSAELRIAGTSGTLAAPFTCDQGDQTLKVSSGQIQASGNKLTGTRNAAISGTANTGEMLSGTATTKIDCTRLSGGSDAGGSAGGGGQAGSGGGGNVPFDGAAGVDCTTAQDCSTCCDDHLPDGVNQLEQLLIDCACQLCAAECATTLCDASNPNQPKQGDACDTCARTAIDADGTCVSSTASACQADDACAPYANCLASCQ